MSRPIGDPVKRFWSKVRKTKTCWLWMAGLTTEFGYGQFSYGPRGNQTHIGAHRYARDNMRDMVKKGRNAKHERNAASVLTLKQVKEIRATSSILSVSATARLTGMSRRNIRDIRSGKLWR